MVPVSRQARVQTHEQHYHSLCRLPRHVTLPMTRIWKADLETPAQLSLGRKDSEPSSQAWVLRPGGRARKGQLDLQGEGHRASQPGRCGTAAKCHSKEAAVTADMEGQMSLRDFHEGAGMLLDTQPLPAECVCQEPSGPTMPAQPQRQFSPLQPSWPQPSGPETRRHHCPLDLKEGSKVMSRLLGKLVCSSRVDLALPCGHPV